MVGEDPLAFVASNVAVALDITTARGHHSMALPRSMVLSRVNPDGGRGKEARA
jgi:hypothetical protein